MTSFASQFSATDYVLNDRRVALWFEQLVQRDVTFHNVPPGGQSNVCQTRVCY